MNHLLYLTIASTTTDKTAPSEESDCTCEGTITVTMCSIHIITVYMSLYTDHSSIYLVLTVISIAITVITVGSNIICFIAIGRKRTKEHMYKSKMMLTDAS